MIQGPDAGKHETFGAEEVNVGSLPTNDLALSDSAVSRYHLRIATGTRGFEVKDLDSTNGTFVGELRIKEVFLRPGVELPLGIRSCGFSRCRTWWRSR